MNLELLLLVGLATAIGVAVLVTYVPLAYSLARFAYAVARIRVMQGKMLREEKIKALIESYSADDVIAAFEGTIYQPYIPTTKDLPGIETGLAVSLAASYQKVVAMAPPSAQEFFSLVSGRYALENVKKVYAAKYAQQSVSFLFPSSFSKEFEQKLVDASSTQDVLELVKQTEFGASIRALPASPAPVEVERAIDRHLYEELLSRRHIQIAAHSGGVLNDAAFLPELYGMMADILNIKLALRAKQDALNAEATRGLFMRNGHYVTEALRNALAESDSVPGVISALEGTPFHAPLSESLPRHQSEKKLFALEQALDKFYYTTVRGMFPRQAFGITPIACFLLLKEMEITALRTVMKGISLNIPKQELQELVVYLN